MDPNVHIDSVAGGLPPHFPGVQPHGEGWISFLFRRQPGFIEHYRGRIGKVIHYWPERALSSKAQDLVEFDMASIRLLTHGAEPTVWLVSTDQYEHNGRVLRDSPSPRLVAYFADTGM